MTRADALAWILRETGGNDIGALAEVMDAAFDSAFGEAWTPAQCLSILDMPGVWLTLGAPRGTDSEKSASGFALARIAADEAELLLIGVRPSCRRQGLGRALLRHTMAAARARGARLLHLEVRQGNEAAELYRQAGFVQVGRRPDYYRGADGALFDALSLSMTLD